MARRRFALNEPIATSAAIPSTIESDASNNRRRDARESRQAMVRMNIIEGEEPRYTRRTRKSENDALGLELRIMAEVHEQPEAVPGCTKIVVDLGTMFVRQGCDGLELNDDRPVAHEIRTVRLSERPALVSQAEPRLCYERNALVRQFVLQALLKHGLEKPTALLAVNFKAGAHQLVGLLRIQNVLHTTTFRVLRVFRG